MISLRQLDESHRPIFEELLREIWRQTWSDDLAKQIVQWRYYDRPEGAVTWLALEKDRCVGMLDSMLRPYMLNGQKTAVRETADWYCMPHVRPYGVGLWLLRKLVAYPEPVFVLGGSECTLRILPKLHWTVLPSASGYVFPIKTRGLVANIIRQKWWKHEAWARLIPDFPVRAPKRIAAPSGRRANIHRVLDTATIALPLPSDGGLVQLFEPQHWAWMVKMPSELARPVGLEFYLDDVLIGFSLSQIEPTAAGFDARIVYLQCDESSAYGWIISETTRILADEYDVGFVRCCVSTPQKTQAIEQVGFYKTRDIPCHWWQRSATMPNSIDVSYLRADDAIPFHALRGRQIAGAIHV